MNKLVLLLVALLCASSLIASPVVASRHLESNDELREQRLRNLAETIAELQQEAQEQRNDNEPQRTFVQLGSDANTTSSSNSSSSSNSTSSSSSSNSTVSSSSTVSSNATVSSNSTKSSNSSDEYHERKTPTLQGTNRADLVALYRFESKENPGRGFGGPGRNLHVFGKGIQIVTGDEAKRGKGSLFIPARPTSVPDKVDPTNPYQNSFLAKNSRGTPISGLPTGDDSFTVAAWYKVVPTKPGRYGVLSFGQLQRNQANLFQVTSNGRAVGSFKTGIPLKSNATRDTTSTWHHAAITWNRDTNMHTVYTDGVITAQRKLERAPDVSSGQFFLGVTANQPESEQFSGFLDDVAIFKVPLTQQEIVNVKKGRFHPYLDLFSLRNCRTRLGRRQHGAGFVVGAADETISFNNSTKKYGYETKNAFACSVACARTTNCRQSVFLVNPSYADTNLTGYGNCYLQSVKHSTYEADKLATSTVCDRPSESLQKSSFLLKTSPDFDEQTAKRVKRVRKEKAAAEAKAKAETAAKEAAEAKKIDEARKAEAKKVEAAKTAEQKATEKKARAAEAAKHAQEEEEHRAADKKKAEAREANRSAAQKAAKAAAKAEHEAKLTDKIESKYLDKITALKDALRAKEAKLKSQKAQASHRALVESERTTHLIAKLNSRLAKLSKKLAQKDEETKMLALASSIKHAADQKAAEIVAAAKSQVDKVRKRSRRTHRNRLRLNLEKKKKSKKAKKSNKKKLTKAQKKAAKKKAAALKAMAAADKAKAKASAAKLKRQLARAAKKKRKQAAVSKPNPAQNGGMKF